MKLVEKTQRFGEHKNAFGFLRLLFASLVIVAHVPEIVDGNSSRELLHRITGTISFGIFAVYGFFVISGYLITSSLLNSPSRLSYLKKRAARIYPGFIAASLVCLAVVTPLAGGDFKGGPLRAVAASLSHMAVLGRPTAEHAFAGQHYSEAAVALNGAMWTIQYEAACYVLLLGIGALGLLQRRWAVPALAACCLAVGTFASPPMWLSDDRLFPGAPIYLFLFPGMFLAGSSFYLHRQRIRFSAGMVSLCAAAFALSLLSTYTVAFGYAIFGSYLIFASAKGGAGTWLKSINNTTDISYGVYLYAWPAEKLLIHYIGAQSLVLLATATWLSASVMGWLSWHLVESPALAFVAKGSVLRVQDDARKRGAVVDREVSLRPGHVGVEVNDRVRT